MCYKMDVWKSLIGNHGNSIVVILLVTAVLLEFMIPPVLGTVAYQFPRYTYKKKPKVERLFKQEWRKCETTRQCEQLFGVEKTRCIRVCLAPICHEEIYAHDELEEGEIDVRGSSFKGCWRQRYHDIRIVVNRPEL